MGGGSPYIGMILPVGFTFAPLGWFFCDGSLQPIAQYETLFALLGTTFGGNGQTTFGIPDLRGRTPIHQGTDAQGNTYVMGGMGGAETVQLNVNQLPAHSHNVAVSSNDQSSSTPNGNFLAGAAPAYINPPSGGNSALAATSISVAPGGGVPHDNLQPYLCINWIINWNGIFPPHS